jgi:hypothetical protein
MKKPTTKRSANTIDVTQSLPALKQAAKNARELARATGTPLLVWKDGKVVDLNAKPKRRATKRASARR